MFKCGNSLQCVSLLLVCDGTPECMNGADELKNTCGKFINNSLLYSVNIKLNDIANVISFMYIIFFNAACLQNIDQEGIYLRSRHETINNYAKMTK